MPHLSSSQAGSIAFFSKSQSLKIFVWIVALLLCAAPGRANTWFVTNAADSGPGTLRGYVASASPGDTISFSDSMYGQIIHLTGGRLLIGQSSLIIDDTGGLLSIDGGGKSPLLEMTNSTRLYVLSVTLTNGYNTNEGTIGTTGGAIVMDSGTLIMYNCTLSGNYCAGDGGAIYDGGGSLNLINCTFSGNYSGAIGGAVVAFTGSSVLISNCTLSGNSSYDGGSAIGNNGSTLIMANSTLASNFSPTGTGGIGGGIFINDGPVTLYNCTLTGNTSGTEGGGIFNNIGTLVMTNTILAGNIASSNQDIVGSYSGANNFVGGDPKLVPLGNYGGPTQTMRPLYGSPVIDAGSDSVASFIPEDQRGRQRLYGAHVDIGAVEAEYAPTNQAVVKIVTRATNECEIAFTNIPNVNFLALTSTNLVLPLTDWTQLGYAIQILPGQYQFTDTSATNRMQFYSVVAQSE